MVSNAFVASAPLPRTVSRRPSTCARRTPRAQTGSNPGPPNTGEWSDGSNMQQGLQKIEFIVRPNGIVEEHVMGVKGNDCVKLTAKLENALGKVVSEKKTSEYFENKVTVSESIKETISDGTEGNWSSGSKW